MRDVIDKMHFNDCWFRVADEHGVLPFVPSEGCWRDGGCVSLKSKTTVQCVYPGHAPILRYKAWWRVGRVCSIWMLSYFGRMQWIHQILSWGWRDVRRGWLATRRFMAPNLYGGWIRWRSCRRRWWWLIYLGRWMGSGTWCISTRHVTRILILVS